MESRDNKYFKWYWSICNRAKDRVLEGSIYGQNKNLVKLTAKEHYIVHLLLWWGLRTKYGTNNEKTKKMLYAFIMMSGGRLNQGRYKIKNAGEYSLIRTAYSENNKGRKISKETRDKMSKSQKLKKVSDETRQKISESNKKVIHTKEWNHNVSISNKGKKHWNYGNTTSVDTRMKMSKTRSKPVNQYNKNNNLINNFNSIKEATMFTGINGSSIIACCKNKRKTAGGFIWTYNNGDIL